MVKETYQQAVERLHRLAVERGRNVYRDPVTRALVCTKPYLASRGSCCGCDCRHCPFETARPTPPAQVA